MPQKWRLLVDRAASGPWNMGVDEALLETAIAAGVPAIRFYRWDGPWLSLGYGQTVPPARRDACSAAGVGIVRRATGGRAVLHGRDLTYALAAPEGLLPDGLRATYEVVSVALRDALLALGVDAMAAPRSSSRSPGSVAAFDCFAEAAGDELCVGSRKLVGSAQRRARGGVLQHGSIRVRADPPAAREAAGLDPEGATSLFELGCEADAALLVAALTDSFGNALGASFANSMLSDRERRAAEARSDAPGSGRAENAESPSGASRAHLDGR